MKRKLSKELGEAVIANSSLFTLFCVTIRFYKDSQQQNETCIVSKVRTSTHEQVTIPFTQPCSGSGANIRYCRD
jgi:hypothetical protein